MIGLRFNKLVVVNELPRIPKTRKQWLCKCDCGGSKVASIHDLKRSFVKQCRDCAIAQIVARSKTHGHASGKYSPTYHSWASMLTRVRNSNRKQAKDYKLRGITVCSEWLDFTNFLKDMGVRPEKRSLDRIDNNKGYEPSNCRWATSKEQNNNKRKRQIQ